ncbi:MAG: hypothetical protein CW346_11395 [Bacillaceae bacterium]|nr:hypothetical protein [Bacillaceae bacterium]
MVLPPKCRPVHHAKGDASGSRGFPQASGRERIFLTKGSGRKTNQRLSSNHCVKFGFPFGGL